MENLDAMVRTNAEIQALLEDWSEADNAVASRFPYGVSTSSRLPSGIASSGEYGSATRSAIEQAGLSVLKTGNSPFHYTVTFPGPVDDDLAGIFNSLFYGSAS